MNKLIIISLALFISSFCLAQAGLQPMKDVSSFKENLEASAKATNTIDSDFTQYKYLSFLSEEIESTGHFSFKKDNLLRWEYFEPFEYLIVLNDSKLMIKDEDDVSNFDLDSNQAFQKINDMIVNSVQGDVLDEELYDMTFKENSDFYFVELIPVDEKMKEYMQAIHLYFDREDYSVSKIKMIELSEDYTTIKFTNKKLNAEIPNERFSIN